MGFPFHEQLLWISANVAEWQPFPSRGTLLLLLSKSAESPKRSLKTGSRWIEGSPVKQPLCLWGLSWHEFSSLFPSPTMSIATVCSNLTLLIVILLSFPLLQPDFQILQGKPGSMVQVVQHLPGKSKALSSKPQYHKKLWDKFSKGLAHNCWYTSALSSWMLNSWVLSGYNLPLHLPVSFLVTSVL